MGTFLFWVGVAIVGTVLGGLVYALIRHPEEVWSDVSKTALQIRRWLGRDDSLSCPECGRGDPILLEVFPDHRDMGIERGIVEVTVAELECSRCGHYWKDVSY